MRAVFRVFLLAACLLLGLGAGQSFAIEPGSAQQILNRLKEARPDLHYGKVKPSPIAGLYEVEVKNGPILYVTEKGDYFLAGDLFAVEKGGFINIAEQQREQKRADSLAAIQADEMIVFSPKQRKAAVYVFTDIDCGYCQKLHREVPELNSLGIEVRYLAFPRAGIGSSSYKKIVTAWCSADRQDAITRLKNREHIASLQCADNPVARQYQLGQQLGVSGTPALVTETGVLLPGYRPAHELAEILGVTM
jgi:thiol:disulfide interchange protein DsbC